MQSSRPNVIIAPLQLGLAVQMHHQFASRFLIDTLHHQGFCVSYSEVQKFERSAAVTQDADTKDHYRGHFIQFVADNVDHNIRTIDGLNTFHGMGMIASMTPVIHFTKQNPRATVTSKDIEAVGRINTSYFRKKNNSGELLKYEELFISHAADKSKQIDLMWKIAFPLVSHVPAWSGYMQMVRKGNHPGDASVQFLPIIDMSPSYMSCVLSTLQSICNQARQYGITPIITFDQPLWWKALTVILNESENSDLHSIVLKLGGFHTLMSFLGSIGHLMDGSGLNDILEVAYAPNAVGHMLSGKAYSRAVRGHFLVDAALNALLFSYSFKIDFPVKCPTTLMITIMTVTRIQQQIIIMLISIMHIILKPMTLSLKQKIFWRN